MRNVIGHARSLVEERRGKDFENPFGDMRKGKRVESSED